MAGAAPSTENLDPNESGSHSREWELRSVHRNRSTTTNQLSDVGRRKYVIGSQSCHSLIYSIDDELESEFDAIEASGSETDFRLPPLDGAYHSAAMVNCYDGDNDVDVIAGNSKHRESSEDSDSVDSRNYKLPSHYTDSKRDGLGNDQHSDHDSGSEIDVLSTESHQFVDDHADSEEDDFIAENHQFDDHNETGEGHDFTAQRHRFASHHDYESDSREISPNSDSKMEDDFGEEQTLESGRCYRNDVTFTSLDDHASGTDITIKDQLVPIVCGSAKYFWERNQYQAGTTVGTRLHQYTNYTCNLDDGQCRGRCEQHCAEQYNQIESTLHGIVEEEEDSSSSTDDDGDSEDDNSDDNSSDDSLDSEDGVNVEDVVRRSPGGRPYSRRIRQRSRERDDAATASHPANRCDVVPRPSPAARTDLNRRYCNFASTLKFWQGVERIVVPNFVREAVNFLEDSDASSDESERGKYEFLSNTADTAGF